MGPRYPGIRIDAQHMGGLTRFIQHAPRSLRALFDYIDSPDLDKQSFFDIAKVYDIEFGAGQLSMLPDPVPEEIKNRIKDVIPRMNYLLAASPVLTLEEVFAKYSNAKDINHAVRYAVLNNDLGALVILLQQEEVDISQPSLSGKVPLGLVGTNSRIPNTPENKAIASQIELLLREKLGGELVCHSTASFFQGVSVGDARTEVSAAIAKKPLAAGRGKHKN